MKKRPRKKRTRAQAEKDYKKYSRLAGQALQDCIKDVYGRLQAKKPGLSWRAQSGSDGCFDELVIDSWLHLEQMDDRVWWLCIGDRQYVAFIAIDKKGKVTITESD